MACQICLCQFWSRHSFVLSLHASFRSTFSARCAPNVMSRTDELRLLVRRIARAADVEAEVQRGISTLLGRNTLVAGTQQRSPLPSWASVQITLVIAVSPARSLTLMTPRQRASSPASSPRKAPLCGLFSVFLFRVSSNLGWQLAPATLLPNLLVLDTRCALEHFLHHQKLDCFHFTRCLRGLGTLAPRSSQLVVPPASEWSLESVLLSIRSFTTDQGVEAGMPFMGNVICEFAVRYGLKPSKEILKWSRTFPLSRHIHDLGRFWSRSMTSAFSSFPSWPENLKQLRTVLAFFFRKKDSAETVSILCPWVGQSWVRSLVRSRPGWHSGD